MHPSLSFLTAFSREIKIKNTRDEDEEEEEKKGCSCRPATPTTPASKKASSPSRRRRRISGRGGGEESFGRDEAHAWPPSPSRINISTKTETGRRRRETDSRYLRSLEETSDEHGACLKSKPTASQNASQTSQRTKSKAASPKTRIPRSYSKKTPQGGTIRKKHHAREKKRGKKERESERN